MGRAVIETETVARELAGWREGKPVEDPGKIKSWGFVHAKPSEFLIHVRGGQVRQETSGQGGSCFKWPFDSVAIVPTTLQQISFSADQVTRENIGVEVRGLAVYRIAEPLLAYRVVNFSFPERAQEKLKQTVGEMCVGASRRIIANLSVDECLRERKAAIADALMEEIYPVLAGLGRPGDHTSQGWGVVVDTIEIQEVRILSENVFSALQAPARAQLEREATTSRTESMRVIAEREADCRRAVETAKLRAELDVAREKEDVERKKAALVHARNLDVAERNRAEEAARLDAQASLQQHALELERQAAESKLAVAELFARAAALDDDRSRSAAVLALDVARVNAERIRAEGAANNESALGAAQAEREKSRGRAELLLAQNAPQIAAGAAGLIKDLNVTHVGGELTEVLANLMKRVS